MGDDAAYGPKAGVLVPLPACERGVAVVTSASPDGRYFVYTNGTNVVVRDLETPSKSLVYAEHSQQVKVAKFAPTGKYVASGDASGKVRIWAWTNEGHTLKFECPALGGEVEDLAWDSESKRIVVAGGGSSKAKVFAWDTGSNLGEIIPHSKKAITCDYRPSRPFRVVFGSEDMGMSFYQGPPFKYVQGIKEHSNFVNCVRFAPDGSRFVSVSSDKSGIVYAGETAAVIGKLDPASMHGGSVFAAAWAPDSKRLVTSGGDKSVKVWDVSGDGPTFPCLATFTLGSRPDDMQQSVAWPKAEVIVSTSLEGTLNYFNAADVGAGPTKRVFGHREPMQCLDVDRDTGAIFTGCTGGRVCVWRPTDEGRTQYEAAICSGAGPTKKVAAVAVAGGQMAAVAWDDQLRIGDAVTGAFTASVPLGGQPKGLAVSAAAPDVRVVPTGSAVLVVKGGAVATTVPAAWGPTCVDMSADGKTVAVGGNDKRVHIFALDGVALSEQGETKEANAPISAVAVSPDGAQVAAGDAGREIRLFATGTREALVSGRWMAHTTRVTGLRWSPSGAHIASVSSDRRLCVWDPKADAPKVTVDLAHPQPFAAVAWAGENELWTLGTDGVAVRRVLAL